MYGRLPFKFMIHVTLVIIIFVQVYLHTSARQRFIGQATLNLAETFMPEGYENLQESLQGTYVYYFLDMDDIVNDIGNTTEKVRFRDTMMTMVHVLLYIYIYIYVY